MKTRLLEGALVGLKCLKMQLTNTVHGSIYPISWMSLFLFLLTCMNFCCHPFLIL